MRWALAIVLACAACESPPSELSVESGRDPMSGFRAENTPTMAGFSWVVDRQLAAMPAPGRTRPLEQDLRYLQAQGIELLISLTERPTDPEALDALGIERLHLPVPDFTAPSLEQLDTFVTTVNTAVADEHPVGVHCTAGLGRSGTVVAAYFVSEGMSADEAIAHIRRLRPGSVETAAQEQRIAEYATWLARCAGSLNPCASPSDSR